MAAAPDAAPNRPSNALFARCLLAAALTLPVFLVEMRAHLYPPLHHWIAETIGLQNRHILQLLLMALVLVGPGAGFFRRGIPGLLRASGHGCAGGPWGGLGSCVFGSGHDRANSLAPLRCPFRGGGGHCDADLSGARAKGRTGDAVRRLIGLRPDTVDGIVTEGQTHIDEAMLTGEPIPVLKAPGETVSAGSLSYRATHAVRDTVLARIATLTEQAQAARLPVEELVNKISRCSCPQC